MADIKTSFHKLDRASATHKYHQQKNQKKFFKLLKKSNNHSSDDNDSDSIEINKDLNQKKLKVTHSKATLLDPAAQRIEDRFSDIVSIPSDEEETAFRQR